jgi:hypothetical protein
VVVVVVVVVVIVVVVVGTIWKRGSTRVSKKFKKLFLLKINFFYVFGSFWCADFKMIFFK